VSDRYNWKQLEEDYTEGVLSYADMCKKHDIDKGYLCREAKKREWVRAEVKKSPPPRLIGGKFISRVAKDRYELTKEKMGDELNIIDDHILIPLVNMYARMLELEAIVLKEGVSVISPKTGASYTNPSYNALLSATKSVASLGKELGLTVTSRKRAGVSPKIKETKKSIFDLVDTGMDDLDV
jgi:P27 family predicted phage terminase small subunit